MRLYSGSSQQFIEDTVQNQISEKLKLSFFNAYRYYPPQGELISWRNSLRAINQLIQFLELKDHGVLLEYQLPLSSKRLDFMITGYDGNKNENAIIVELKQWDRCMPTDGSNEVLTFIGGREREVLHPSAQVGQYHQYLSDTHTAFYEGDSPISLNSCSYLHNYYPTDGDEILSDKFSEHLERFPIFTADSVSIMSDYLLSKLQNGDGLGILKRVEESEYRPSKKLMEHVGNVIKGKSEYILLDEQLIAYDKVFSCVKTGFHDKRGNVIIIKGGPGTGKSVIAINLMSDLLLENYNAQYATGSKAFTETLRAAIGLRGAVQFKYFNSYSDAENNAIDVLIADEAHRIRVTSDNRFTPKQERSNIPQIEELINTAKVAVFLLDDDQVVRPNEIGSVDYIKDAASRLNCNISEYELEVQFRCAGSEAFVNWINNTLGVKRTANIIWEGDENFDFQIVNSPIELEEKIRAKVSEGNTGRVTAGFCWKWSKQLEPDDSLKEDVEIEDYKRPWNARHNATGLPSNIPKAHLWAYDPNGINQIGCIYTAQGFEFDYVGVIFGKDLIYDLDKTWIGNKEKSQDSVVKRSGDKFLDLVKNTYRVLLSRGMKGCYVYFMDKDTERFFKSRME